jgi:hypothetical protein
VADKDDAAVAAEIENLRSKIQRAQDPPLIEGSAEPQNEASEPSFAVDEAIKSHQET